MGFFTKRYPTLRGVHENVYVPPADTAIARVDQPRSLLFMNHLARLQERDPQTVIFKLIRNLQGEGRTILRGGWSAIAELDPDHETYGLLLPTRRFFGDPAKTEAFIAVGRPFWEVDKGDDFELAQSHEKRLLEAAELAIHGYVHGRESLRPVELTELVGSSNGNETN